jgi:hypothetical protein
MYHNKAKIHIEENYKKWNEAYSTSLTWVQYLDKLSKLENVGIWIKEVSNVELKKNK